MKSAPQKVVSEKLISIGMLYSYIFEGIKVLSDTKTLESKQKEIKSKIMHQFSELLSNKNLSEQFRYLLRELKASQLEEVLFGNCKDALMPPPNHKQYKIPDDVALEKKFIALNAQYKFFNDSDVNAKAAFMLYFKGFKLTADFIEYNNDENDSLPAAHAYKMLVLFGSPKKTSPPFKLIEQHISKQVESDHPVHDAFLHVLPINEPTIKDMTGWRKLIANNKKGISYFQEAIEIEKKLGKAPATIYEAEKISSQLTYARFKENLELALLCKHYKLGEAVFNRCLEIELNRKKTDNIPDIAIDGATIGHPGYHLLKLPLDDPRAYILGHITNCCQSVGGHTEHCIVDGVTLANNSFYVLVKANKKSAKPKTGGKINYTDFKIIGQGYVWLSQNGNLTIDTWENLRKEDDAIATSLLKKFSQEVTKQTDALRVTIGTGGKTPIELKTCELILMPSRPTKETLDNIPIKSNVAYVYSENKIFYINKTKNQCEELKISLDKVGAFRSELNPSVKARILSTFDLHTIQSITGHIQSDTKIDPPEVMREGIKCEDSSDQALLYLDEGKLNKMINVLLVNNLKNELFWDNEREFRELLCVDKMISLNEAKQISHLISRPDNQLFWRTLMSEYGAGKYKKIIKEGGRDCILALCALSQAHALTEENFKLMIQIVPAIRMPFIANALLTLHHAGILNDENRAFITQGNLTYSDNLAEAVIILHQSGILNQQNRKIIMSNLHESKRIADALVILNDAGILNDKIRHIINNLIKPLQYDMNSLVTFARALVILHESNLANDENIKCIMPGRHVQDPRAAARTLVLLHKAHPENTGHAITVGKYANKINSNLIKAFEILDKANLFNEDMFITIMNSEDLYSSYTSIATLDKAGILTKDKMMAAIKLNMSDLSITMHMLALVNLLNNDTFQLLLDIARDKKIDILYMLREMLNITILNKENFTSLVSNLKYADQLKSAIESLIRQRHFTIHTFKDIMTNPEYAHNIAEAWGILHKADLLNEKTRNILLHVNPKTLVSAAKAFVTLHQADMFTSTNRKLVLQHGTQASDKAKALVFEVKWKFMLADEVQTFLNNLKDISSQGSTLGFFKFGYTNKEIFDAGKALVNLLRGNITGKFDKEKYLPVLIDGELGKLLDHFVKTNKPEKIQTIPKLVDYACANVYAPAAPLVSRTTPPKS